MTSRGFDTWATAQGLSVSEDGLVPLRVARLAWEAGRAEERERSAAITSYAHEATKAITSLTIGGSEFFGKRIGDMYTADLPFCVQHIRDRIKSGFDAKLALIAANRKKPSPSAQENPND